MIKWVLLILLNLALTITLRGQQQDETFVAPTVVDGSFRMLPLLFNHAGPAGLQGNGMVEERLNGKRLFKGMVKNGKLHGQWQSWYQNGMHCDAGQLSRGLPDGTWQYWDEDGQLLALRTYSAEKYQRISHEMLRYNPKRISYPLVKLYAKNRHEALRYLHAGLSFDITVDTQTEALATRVAGNITGSSNYKPVFNRSLHHGLFMNFYPGGAVKDSGYYQNGLQHGIWKRVHENGNTETGAYQHGVKVRDWKTFDANGKIIKLVVYTSSGKIRKTRSFD